MARVGARLIGMYSARFDYCDQRCPSFDYKGCRPKLPVLAFPLSPKTLLISTGGSEMINFVSGIDAGSSVLNSGSGVLGSGLDLGTAIVKLIGSIVGIFA
ncbi:hypothetical protein FOH10_05000 [Nocardia otitidiscaviarum]|uniref:Uncharacterized protein n=2 Tax=Nocardia otitidiscaviarum TaxID=1823 RepID=A0A516NH14_9NOCA|nr:hypothetical protein [Nocardia otitidiscaviarum]MCP9619530.1 hypothetical protein [Nocardia otitidiscaviarum]QDP78191.1 hypothetical protein FOH10_05000 [Nocardia otitidiscaviarum]